MFHQSLGASADSRPVGVSHALGEVSLRTIPPDLLIAPDFQHFSTRQVVGKDRILDIYFHRSAGSVQISGGEYGVQSIQALPLDRRFISFFKKSIAGLDRLIKLDFRYVPTAEKADVRLYSDSEITLGGLGVTLGIALSNDTDQKDFWEIMINAPAFNGNVNYFYYAALHEFGHALGLEHPFDSSDGDVFESTDSSFSAYPEETMMAYRNPQGGVWPTRFSTSDLAALKAVWGEERSARSTRRLASQRLIGANLEDELIGRDDLSPIGAELHGDLITAAGVDEIRTQGLKNQLVMHGAIPPCLDFSPIPVAANPFGQLDGIGVSDLSLEKLQGLTVGLPDSYTGNLV